MTRILITGATGLFGPYVAAASARLGKVITTGLRGGDVRCDLRNEGDVRRLISEVHPEIVVHMAAATDVDYCERHPDAAYEMNELSVVNLVQALRGVLLVYMSTDQVYPDTAGPHAEPDTGPVNVYGHSKLAGERAALQNPESLVARVNFFGPSRTKGRASLSDFFVEKFAHREPVSLFTDSAFSPLSMKTLSGLLVEAIEQRLTGVFNFASRDGMSKQDFAMAIAAYLGLDPSNAVPVLSQAAGRAPRPRDLRMSADRLEAALGRSMPPLRDEIATLAVVG